MTDKAYKTDDPQKVSDAKKLEKNQEDMRKHDIEWLMSSERGRRIVWFILADCESFGTGFVDGNLAYFKQGIRHVGVNLLKEVMAYCPDLYTKMTTENQDKEQYDG